ncbi:MAG: low molecular weight protein-tyrosine-phosphatase [Vampirovibrionales bacterium]|nr:low molecular weight protein-tyrosine-phosphatase [Vampirovibrionales bacterium]
MSSSSEHHATPNMTNTMATITSQRSPCPLSVLFVCMGNICRSPLAEGLFYERIKALDLLHCVEIDSAGTHDYHVGRPPDTRAREAAKRHGFSIDDQRCRQVDDDDFERFDIILAMDNQNLALLQSMCPPARHHKLYRMMSFAQQRPETEVPDPYFGGHEGFDHVVALLQEATEGLYQHIQKQIPV